jgi:hypothetical protein
MHILWAKCPDARPAFDSSAGIRWTEPGTESVVEEALELGEWIIVEVNKGHDNKYVCARFECAVMGILAKEVFPPDGHLYFSRIPYHSSCMAEESY